MSFMQQPRSFGRAINRRQSDDFARSRSRYVDMFSHAELRLSKLYNMLGLKKPENTVGQKIGEMALLKPSHTLSKAAATQIRSICSDISPQIKVRNGIVHATMSIGTKSGEDVAFFQKSSDAAASHPNYFVMGFDDFSAAIELIDNLNKRIDALLTQLSSRPQPKQA